MVFFDISIFETTAIIKICKFTVFSSGSFCQIYRVTDTVTDEALIAETMVWPNVFLMNVFFALKGSKLFIIISYLFAFEKHMYGGRKVSSHDKLISGFELFHRLSLNFLAAVTSTHRSKSNHMTNRKIILLYILRKGPAELSSVTRCRSCHFFKLNLCDSECFSGLWACAGLAKHFWVVV